MGTKGTGKRESSLGRFGCLVYLVSGLFHASLCHKKALQYAEATHDLDFWERGFMWWYKVSVQLMVQGTIESACKRYP